tara:strand:+ start:595 stop:876 length:282 start_codon:yes stop_codon:yes gene_type:complete
MQSRIDIKSMIIGILTCLYIFLLVRISNETKYAKEGHTHEFAEDGHDHAYSEEGHTHNYAEKGHTHFPVRFRWHVHDANDIDDLEQWHDHFGH